MPIQRLAMVIGHDIGPGDSIIHCVKRWLIHDMGQKTGKSRPVIKPGYGAALNLIGTDCMIDGLQLLQGWMTGREARNLFFEIDVMGPLMHKSISRDDWFDPIERAFYGLGA